MSRTLPNRWRELSGALAHELNQPLAAIMSNAEAARLLLARPKPDLAEIRAILDDIVEADTRASEVIQRMRDLVKGDPPHWQPVALNPLVEDVLRFTRTDLARRSVALETSLGPDLPEIRADRVPLEQVLINLVRNAGDAMRETPREDRVVKIRTCANAGHVIVSVADSGCGLPEMPYRVFEPFYTTKPDGLGMGLSISRSIVEAHGGLLWAKPNDGRGATFHVSLPVGERE